MIELFNHVVKHKLCTGCGTCMGCCPTEALGMRLVRGGYYVPYLMDPSKCIQCGRCVDVCPGIRWDTAKLHTEWLDRLQFQNDDLGPYHSCYVGFAADPSVRKRGASGGTITAVLEHAFSTGIIDGAVVTRMNGIYGTALIAHSVQEICNAAKSKYTPVHFGQVLRTIRNSHQRMGVVGLPCHIQGIRKAQLGDSRLKENIAFCLGLFCGHNVGVDFTRFVLQKYRIPEKDVQSISYREVGWWNFSISIQYNGRLVFIPFRNSVFGINWNTFLFTPRRCLLCMDLTCESADMSFGDAWLPEYEGEEVGKSVVVVRSEIGKQLIGDMETMQKLVLTKVDAATVARSQQGQIYFKKKQLIHRMGVMKILLKKVPKFEIKEVKKFQFRYFPGIVMLLSYRSFCFLLYRIGLLRYMPLMVMKIYGKVQRFLKVTK